MTEVSSFFFLLMHIRWPGLIISCVFLALVVSSYFFPYKPRFVVPNNRRFTYVSIFAIAILVLLPLNIRITDTNTVIEKQIVPVQILFDVSLSMTADDLPPSRFAVAKNMVETLTQSWKGYPVSIILFSGIPFVHIPFSTNTQAILGKRSTTHLGQFPPVPQFVGTAIGDALLLGVQNMERNNFSSGVIILITDGDSNIGYEPTDVMNIVQKKHIPIYAVGIGKSDAFTVGYDIFSNPVYTTYNPLFLADITQKVGGQTFVLDETEDIQSILTSLKNNIEKSSYAISSQSFFSLNAIFFPLIFLRILRITALRIRIRYTNK